MRTGKNSKCGSTKRLKFSITIQGSERWLFIYSFWSPRPKGDGKHNPKKTFDTHGAYCMLETSVTLLWIILSRKDSSSFNLSTLGRLPFPFFHRYKKRYLRFIFLNVEQRGRSGSQNKASGLCEGGMHMSPMHSSSTRVIEHRKVMWTFRNACYVVHHTQSDICAKQDRLANRPEAELRTDKY